MVIADIASYLTEEHLTAFMETFRSFGPLPGILLTFMKSFIPPLPTMIIVGVNAAVYGLWLGFLYSWIGIVSGCLVTFLIIRKIAGHRYLERWSQKPKVQKAMLWVRHNAFSYVFLLSIFPVGPFVIINMVAAVAQMRLRSYLIAILFGKALMVFSVSIIGHDLERFVRHPIELIYVVLFIGISLFISKKIEARFTKATTKHQESKSAAAADQRQSM
ncbi:TVP38/TMEM64 family protein [Paenibacillus sp. UMB4589-SE434]|uniref:TVP38/TMEM64 family protein n=1 Tax=Paenibacillus sp. UMB4589-SE434 TaxID=3046314 RepID=UPI00254B1545|nr:TVP38/TMEM64 family protein [Paenibacillus sp. UMB4589-SE434]MDK8181385.1 TVP38/TMEM64 family protein [Paenibacillus sp. UMB4589-SE434]